MKEKKGPKISSKSFDIKVARPSQYGLPDKEEILVTKDGVRIRSYVLIQHGDDVAIQSPTLLCLHVWITLYDDMGSSLELIL